MELYAYPPNLDLRKQAQVSRRGARGKAGAVAERSLPPRKSRGARSPDTLVRVRGSDSGRSLTGLAVDGAAVWKNGTCGGSDGKDPYLTPARRNIPG